MMDKSNTAEKILSFTLEIISLLTGEDYTIVKKTSLEHVAPIIHPLMSRGWSSGQIPITTSPAHSLIHDSSHEKILDLTYKIAELLTGEVPIRCQDVTVHFSKEEWEYLDGHKDLYKDITMEDHQPPTSPDASSKGDLLQTYPSDLYSQDCPDEHFKLPSDHQVGDLLDIKVEVIENEDQLYIWDGQHCKEEETPTNMNLELQIPAEKTQGNHTASLVYDTTENMKSRGTVNKTGEEKLAVLFSQLETKYGPTQTTEDCFPSNPLKSAGSDAEEFEENPSRVGNNKWCRCQNCIPMPTALESVCCQEIDKALENMEGHLCITQHKSFNIYCENPTYVNISMQMIGNVRLPPPEKDRSRSLRKAAYRGFLAWIHGYLGLKNRKPVPSCVVKKVRDAFQYTGLHVPNDYAAEYMAID